MKTSISPVRKVKSPTPKAKTLPPKKVDLSNDVNFRKILVPIDFSDAAMPALHYAKSLARLTGGRLYLLHVIQPVYAGAEFAFVEMDLSGMREQLTRKMGALQMEEFRGIPSDFDIREGLPFDEIVNAASDCKADLIVMTTHGYTGLRHVIMGSTAERVVRHAPCPVLVVRSDFPDKLAKPAVKSVSAPKARVRKVPPSRKS